MHYKKDFDMFVGGKSGVFKGIRADKKACIMKNIQSLMSIRADHEVTAMTWCDEEEKDILLGCGSKCDRSVKIYDTQCGAFTSSSISNHGHGNIKGLARYNEAVITAVESGHIKLWRFDEGVEFSINAGANLEKMRHSFVNKNLIATGGREHKLQLFDLEKHTNIFTEKNVSHDWLELKVPLWISDISFVPNTSQVVTCSKLGHVRLYDPGAQRRPVINLEVKDETLTTLALSPRERHVVVGSGRGVMNLIDLRKPGRILNTYKDFAGSITAIACPRSNPFIVSVSLDRYMRIHHLDTKKLLRKVYLTSRLSSMVLRSAFTLNSIDEVNNESKKHHGKRSLEQTQNDDDHRLIDIESNSESEYDEIFDKMAVIDNKKNETTMIMENKPKRQKMKKLKPKDPKINETFMQENHKRLKGIRNRPETITI